MFFKRRTQAPQSDLGIGRDIALQELLQAMLRAVCVNKGSDFVENDSTGEAMRNYLDRNIRETASNEAKELFCIEHKGMQLYPVFTSEQHLEEWIGKNPFAGQRITALTVLSFQGARLFRRFSDVPPSVVVVLDPMSSGERFLTTQELQTLSQS